MRTNEGEAEPIVFCDEHRESAFHLVASGCPRCGKITNRDYRRCGWCAAELALCQACDQPGTRIR